MSAEGVHPFSFKPPTQAAVKNAVKSALKELKSLDDATERSVRLAAERKLQLAEGALQTAGSTAIVKAEIDEWLMGPEAERLEASERERETTNANTSAPDRRTSTNGGGTQGADGANAAFARGVPDSQAQAPQDQVGGAQDRNAALAEARALTFAATPVGGLVTPTGSQELERVDMSLGAGTSSRMFGGEEFASKSSGSAGKKKAAPKRPREPKKAAKRLSAADRDFIDDGDDDGDGLGLDDDDDDFDPKRARKDAATIASARKAWEKPKAPKAGAALQAVAAAPAGAPLVDQIAAVLAAAQAPMTVRDLVNALRSTGQNKKAINSALYSNKARFVYTKNDKDAPLWKLKDGAAGGGAGAGGAGGDGGTQGGTQDGAGPGSQHGLASPKVSPKKAAGGAAPPAGPLAPVDQPGEKTVCALSDKVFLRVSTFNGNLYVHAREYFSDAAGASKPGRKGCGLALPLWEILNNSLDEIEDALAKASADKHEVCQLNQKWRVSVSLWQGKKVVDIREYYQKNQCWSPGKKGISLKPDEWKKLIDSADDVDDAVAELQG